MNIIWKTIRKPLVWKPLFVLSVFGLNFLMGNDQSTIAAWTFFSTILVLCFGNINSLRRSSSMREKGYFEKEADRRRMNYGSPNNYTMYDRDRMFER